MTKISEIPAWLYSPPDGQEPNPPVEVRRQDLPFEELSWMDFERLILRMVMRESEIIECSMYGVPGQAQDGLDILATHKEQLALRVCYQCKKVAEFGPSNIIAAVDKFLAVWLFKSKTTIPVKNRDVSANTAVSAELPSSRGRLPATLR